MVEVELHVCPRVYIYVRRYRNVADSDLCGRNLIALGAAILVTPAPVWAETGGLPIAGQRRAIALLLCPAPGFFQK